MIAKQKFASRSLYRWRAGSSVSGITDVFIRFSGDLMPRGVKLADVVEISDDRTNIFFKTKGFFRKRLDSITVELRPGTRLKINRDCFVLLETPDGTPAQLDVEGELLPAEPKHFS